MLEAGGNFADGVIAHERGRLGGLTFLVRAAGHQTSASRGRVGTSCVVRSVQIIVDEAPSSTTFWPISSMFGAVGCCQNFGDKSFNDELEALLVHGRHLGQADAVNQIGNDREVVLPDFGTRLYF